MCRVLLYFYQPIRFVHRSINNYYGLSKWNMPKFAFFDADRIGQFQGNNQHVPNYCRFHHFHLTVLNPFRSTEYFRIIIKEHSLVGYGYVLKINVPLSLIFKSIFSHLQVISGYNNSLIVTGNINLVLLSKNQKIILSSFYVL